MKAVTDRRLFWFLKEGTELDLSDKGHLDMYVQQTLTRGRTSEIRRLLNMIKLSDFIESFGRIRNFLPKGVRRFWEEWLGDIDRTAKKGPRPL